MGPALRRAGTWCASARDHRRTRGLTVDENQPQPQPLPGAEQETGQEAGRATPCDHLRLELFGHSPNLALCLDCNDDGFFQRLPNGGRTFTPCRPGHAWEQSLEEAWEQSFEEGRPQRIYTRLKALNGCGTGWMWTRRVLLPGGARGWASDLAINSEGKWYSGFAKPHQRDCRQSGVFPANTIVLEYATEMLEGERLAPALARAGLIRDPELYEMDACLDDPISWTCDTRRPGALIEVQLPGPPELWGCAAPWVVI